MSLSKEQKQRLENLVRDTIMPSLFEDIEIDLEDNMMINEAIDFLVETLYNEKVGD